ncbi:MAG: RHS repeat-associated core domain-containing protein, partial [Pirellulales bacterium]
NAGKTAITGLTFAQEWSLDATGNWAAFKEDADGNGTWDLDQSRTHNQVNEISTISASAGADWVDPMHDRAGNMVLIPQNADPTTSYRATWDAWNRLMKLMNGGSTVGEYACDGLFRRTKKLVSGATSHFYYSDKWQVLEERLGISTAADRQFVWGLRYPDNLVCRDRDTNADGTLDERLYAIEDANWNVTVVVNASSAVQERFNYSAYGATSVLTAAFGDRPSSLYDWETRFASCRWDADSGLFILRRRQLHSGLGRFLNRDPLGYSEYGLHLYRFVENDPISLVDPQGMQAVRPDPEKEGAEGPCDCCNAKVKELPLEKYRYRGGKGTCIAMVECRETCPNDLLGYTAPPRNVAPGQYLIDVCISCKIADNSLDAVIAHELVHVERFCAAGSGITNCTSCKIQEGKAYEESCELAFPDDASKRKRCIKCGVYFGCKHLKSDSGKGICIQNEDPPCEFKDLGIEVKP